MATEEKVNLTISAVNKTRAEFDTIVKDLTKVEKQTGKVILAQGKFGKAIKKAGAEGARAMEGLASKAGAAGGALMAIGPIGLATAAAMGAVTVGVVKGTSAFMDWDKQLKRTEALLKSTNYAVGYTAYQLDQLARERDLATLGDKESILGAMGALLTFKSIQGDVFRDTVVLAQDMAATFGQDLRGSIVQLGKALEDPITGLTALRRVGVSFSESEKEMIKAMMDANDVAGAQSKIISILQHQFGGAAEAEAQAGNGLAGAVDTMAYEWRELMEAMEQSEPAAAGVNRLTEAIRALRKAMAPTKEEELADLEAMRDAGLYDIGPAIPNFGDEAIQDPSQNARIKALKEEIAAEKEAQKAAEDAAKAKAKTAAEAAQAEREEAARKKKAQKEAEEAAKALEKAQEAARKAVEKMQAEKNKAWRAEFELLHGGLSAADLATYSFQAEQAYTEGLREEEEERKQIRDDALQDYMDHYRKVESEAGEHFSMLTDLAGESGREAGSVFGEAFSDLAFGELQTFGDYFVSYMQALIQYQANALGETVGSGLSLGLTDFASWLTTSEPTVVSNYTATGSIARAGGGAITEPVVGLGLRTGKRWTFGEKDEIEYVFNRAQMKNLGQQLDASGGVVTLHQYNDFRGADSSVLATLDAKLAQNKAETLAAMQDMRRRGRV